MVEEAVRRLALVAVEEAVRVEEAGLTVRKAEPAELTERVLLTRSVESMVEEAKTNIPAVLEVGVKVLCPEKAICQAPGLPPAVQPEPVVESRPAEEACTQEVAAELKLSKVTAPVIEAVPFSLVVPKTPRVVVGRLVPIPTRFSEALTTRVLRSTIKPPEMFVEVAV